MAGRHGSRNNAGGIPPLIANEDRLAAYDRAANADATAQYRKGRQELEGQKFNFQQQKEAFAESQKLSAAEQRAQEFATKNERLTAASQSMKDLHEATVSALQAKQEATAAMQAHKESETANVAKAATNIFKAFGGLDKTAKDFPAKVWATLADNPDAIANPHVMEAVQHQLDTHEKFMDAKSKADLLAAKPANASQQLEDALAASHPAYGTAGTDPKNPDLDPKKFIQNQAGQDAQTHVLTTYVSPNGKTVTQVFPRDAFDSAVAASKSRQGSAGPTGAPDVAEGLAPDQLIAGNVAATANASAAAAAHSTTVTSIPATAIDYLKQNPNFATHFDDKYGQGSSQQYLAPPAQ